jgi:TPR repeat protein
MLRGIQCARDAADYAKALKWYRKSAEQGDAIAQSNLGSMYGTGDGVPKDSSEAVKWYRKAAEQGNAGGQFNLGFMYATGEGVPLDFAKAMKWYRKAAEQRNTVAQLQLGLMYANGIRVPKDVVEGVPKDEAKAYMFFNLAAANGSEYWSEGEKRRDALAKRMTKEQIAEGQKLTREWLERKAK